MNHNGNNAATRQARNKRIVRRMWQAFGIFVALIVILFVLIYNGIIGYMPPIAELKNPTDKFASTLYSSDGQEMGRIYKSKGNRVYVDFDQLSKHLSDALIATEDVAQANGVEHSLKVVVAVGAAAHYVEAEVDFCVRKCYHRVNAD